MNTPLNVFNYPSNASEIDILEDSISYNQMGIDTIELVAKYETLMNIVKRNHLNVTMLDKRQKHHKKALERVLKGRTTDNKTRLKEEDFKPIVERIELPKVKPKDKGFYITIIRNIPLLFDIATHRKKAKDSYCLIILAGLHQPSKRISSESVKIIKRILNRKTFRVHRIDIAIDTKDKQPINYRRSKEFEADLLPYSKDGVTLEKTSLYINNIDHSNINKVLYYDKYKKQCDKQRKEKIDDSLKDWKRLEFILKFDVTQRENRGFRNYIDSTNFINDLDFIDDVAEKAGVKSYKSDYLIYQLNSLIDNRFLNNKESKKQFNSEEALKRFNRSDSRRFRIDLLENKRLSEKLSKEHGFEIAFE